ncbi:tRNA (uridine-2'-O-)-methyltransferase trm7 [Ophidiomyces ophidiicola]|nr:tRNA (uridine-2'-O-)-methyltransferase trm7 [Ophidiomyces ophidiicola]
MGKSSKDKRDAYYRLAKEQNWRARSAFKLIQIDEQFDLFAHSDPDSVTRVVDLCAAPGSWSQVLSRVLIRAKDKADEEEEEEEEEVAALKPRKNVRIVAIDLQPMAPLEGITTLKADITHPSTIPLLLKALDPDLYTDIENENLQHPSPLRPHPHPVDLVLSDGAPDVTGLHDLDIYIQSQLLYAALNLAIGVLRPGGKFVAKIFRGRDVDLIYAQLKSVFESVSVAKPRSSRASSLEAFVVCEGFMPPVDEKSGESRMGLDNPIFGGGARSDVPTALGTSEMDGMRWIPPFIACGDLSAWDADASYELPPDHVSLDPVQPPTAPPYKRALELRKAKGGAYGKTKGVVYDV